MADKKPPEYYDEMDRRDAAKAKAAYDKASPIGKSIPPAPEKKYAKGGFVRAADGCAQRGKTRGKMI